MPAPAYYTHSFEFGPEPYRGRRRDPRVVEIRVSRDQFTRSTRFEAHVDVRISEELMAQPVEIIRQVMQEYIGRQLAEAIEEAITGARAHRRVPYTEEEFRRASMGVVQQPDDFGPAWDRAERLLLEHLTEAQVAEWKEGRHFTITSQSGRRFRIHYAPANNILELGEDGRVVAEHCVVSTVSVPMPDQLLMQKLMLEYNEREFWRVARSSRMPEAGSGLSILAAVERAFRAGA